MRNWFQNLSIPSHVENNLIIQQKRRGKERRREERRVGTVPSSWSRSGGSQSSSATGWPFISVAPRGSLPPASWSEERRQPLPYLQLKKVKRKRIYLALIFILPYFPICLNHFYLFASKSSLYVTGVMVK